MSRNSKKKKSTSKYRDFKVSPLIAITAIIEAVVLVVVSSFAWFYMATNKQVSIGTVAVDADSGLDIDFKYAREDDYINIWNYVDKDFKFQPVTSLDGRNVFVPTSGTFDKTNTSEMIFREGTVNDINSKYINIDFSLTNTTDYDMKVFLNNNSYFNVKNGQGQSDESRALRLAFYPNDASSGKVKSQLIGTASDQSGQEGQGTATGQKTVYFDNTTWSNNQASKTWDRVYAYIWNSSTNKPYAAWPGVEISRMSGSIYSYSFTDPSNQYNKIIFNNGVGSQTGNLTLTNGNLYDSSGSLGAFTTRTVYFVKPDNWENVYVHAWRRVNGTDQYYTNWDSGTSSGLDEMKSVGSGIYSYTYSYGSTAQRQVYGLLFTNGTKSDSSHQYTQTTDITGNTLQDGKIYYPNGTSGYKVTTTGYGTLYSAMTYKTLYFYNSLGWTNPYIHATVGTANVSLPMTTLGGNVYYCNVPDIYGSIYFKDRVNGSDVSGHKTITIPNNTFNVPLTAGYVYRPTSETDGSGSYKVTYFQYSDYTQDTGFAVISPGVSAGFQRTYSPIVKINNDTGHADQVIPAFSNSIDNYIFGNKAGANGTSQTVFEIGAKHMISLSMVIWLEGTDPSCTSETYAGNNIELRLEFASSYTDTSTNPPSQHNVNTNGSETYKYKFYDKTREAWTSDRQKTESGVTVAPVMQLYDNTVKRGYLMSPESYVTVDGKQKVSCWSVDAPQSVALWGHDIIFRRVNPYDEDEVWNYWHAGRVAGAADDTPYSDKKTATNYHNGRTYTVYTVATEGTDTISFTAFADGSPTREMLTAHGNTTQEASVVPAVSCGGLWGNHSVRTLTLVDGYKSHGLGNQSGLMTMDFYYRYSGGGKTRDVQIEYKSSGPNNTIFYYFVVPDVIYNARDYTRGGSNGDGLTVWFKRYTGYDSGYAINSELNDEIKWAATFNAGKPTGDYFELTQRSDNQNDFYWGTDILYVETTNTTKDYCLSGSDKDKLLQAHFYVTDAGGSSKYAYLYAVDDASIKGQAPTAFVAVVPNNLVYTGYRIECCSWSDPTNSHKKFFTDGHEVKRDKTMTVSTTSGDSTTSSKSFTRCYLNNKNICKLDYFENFYIRFQTNNGAIDNRGGGNGGLPFMYLFKDGGSSYNWPGESMPWQADYSNNIKNYSSRTDFNILTYNKVIFNGGSNQTQTGTLNLDFCSRGNTYECNNINGSVTCVVYNDNANDVIVSNTWATNNAHFAPQQ